MSVFNDDLEIGYSRDFDSSSPDDFNRRFIEYEEDRLSEAYDLENWFDSNTRRRPIDRPKRHAGKGYVPRHEQRDREMEHVVGGKIGDVAKVKRKASRKAAIQQISDDWI